MINAFDRFFSGKRNVAKIFLCGLLSIMLILGLVPYGYADEGKAEQERQQQEEIATSEDQETSINSYIDDLEKQHDNCAEDQRNSEDELIPEIKTDELNPQDEIRTQDNSTGSVRPALSARAHVENIGWMQQLPNISKDTVIGTTGRAKSLEAFTMAFQGVKGLKYRAHVRNVGWQNFVYDGAQAGTTGKAQSIEAIEIILPKELSNLYDVYYQVHARDFGWLGWAKNGETAGTTGFAKSVEAIRVAIVEKGSAAPGSTVDAYKCPAVQYNSHVSNKGWTIGRTASLTTSFIIGTTGQAKALEAFRINNSSSIQGGFSYQAHVRNIGWQPEVSNGAQAGTTGRALSIEAVKIRLTGSLDANYDIYYRAHVRNVGWLDWAKDGKEAGTAGYASPIEAIEVKLVKTGGTVSGATKTPYINKANSGVSLSEGYRNSSGWSNASLAQVAGTTGRAMSLTGIRLSVSSPISGGISYETHNANVGWSGGVSNGASSKGGANAVQAIRISLNGDLSKYFDIYYRAHVRNYGWMGWTKNGANSGTTGLNRPIEAYQVAVVLKGSAAPGTTARAFSDQNGFLGVPPINRAFMNKANQYSSLTNWIILVDTNAHQAAILSGSRGNWKMSRRFSVTTGAPSSPTIKGVFQTTGFKRPNLSTDSRARWCTQIKGGYFFHTILASTSELGHSQSHGCVRLAVPDAQWIYNNINRGTTVVIY